MTTSELATLCVDLVRALSAARCEGDSWRLVALGALGHAHDLHVELVRLRATHHRLLEERRAERAQRAAA